MNENTFMRVDEVAKELGVSKSYPNHLFLRHLSGFQQRYRKAPWPGCGTVSENAAIGHRRGSNAAKGKTGCGRLSNLSDKVRCGQYL